MDRRWCYLLVAATFVCTAAQADERADYNRRSVERFRETFHMVDVDKDGVVTRQEAQLSNELAATFQDIDTDGDGRITEQELARYLGATYGA